jgi:hypothetical protein
LISWRPSPYVVGAWRGARLKQTEPVDVDGFVVETKSYERRSSTTAP